jgi:putative addiction module component (TIGR02574 family)
MKTAEIMHELANLPVDERALIADSLLQTLNASQPDIEQAWLKVAQQRLQEIDSGKVKMVSQEEMTTRINHRLGA